MIIEKILNTLYPNKAGLYPHEILALQIMPIFYLDKKEYYPKYWLYDYGVTDVYKLLVSLKEREFIGTPSIEFLLQQCLTLELKNILKENNLKISGKKTELIERIVKNLSNEKLNNIFHDKNIYVTTEKGKEAIRNDEYVLYAHKYGNNDFDIYSLNKIMKGDTKNYKKYILNILEKKGKKYLKKGEYGLYRNIKLHTYYFFKNTGILMEAIKYLLETIYIDLSGLDNNCGHYPEDNTDYFTYFNDFYISKDALLPSLISELEECRKTLKLSEENFLIKVLQENINTIFLPFHIYTKEECVTIIISAIKDNKECINKIYEQAKKRLQMKYPNINFN